MDDLLEGLLKAFSGVRGWPLFWFVVSWLALFFLFAWLDIL
jgi:hypothetical protein